MSSFRIDDILEVKSKPQNAKSSTNFFNDESFLKPQLNMELIWSCLRAKLAMHGQGEEFTSQIPASPSKRSRLNGTGEDQHTTLEELREMDFPPSSDDDEDAQQLSTMKFDLSHHSALDALIRMANSTMNQLNTSGESDPGAQNKQKNIEIDSTLLGLFNKAAHLRKRRKTRTTFSNAQISELENNFSRQKYLNPADRDRIAKKLNLSNTQVITWFQNRRAKMKRETEELERDIIAAKQDSSLPKSHSEELEDEMHGVSSSYNSEDETSLAGRDSINQTRHEPTNFESNNSHTSNRNPTFNADLLASADIPISMFPSPFTGSLLPNDILNLGWKLLNMSKGSSECKNLK